MAVLKLLVLYLLAVPADLMRSTTDTSVTELDRLAQEVVELRQLGKSLLARVDSLTEEKSEMSSRLDEQAARIAQLNHSVESLSGHDKKPVVAFTARFASGGRVNIGSSSPIRFDRVVTNIGHGYNVHTGIFTAPVSGTYVFFLSLKAVDIRDPVVLGIVKSGRLIANTIAQGSAKDVADKGTCLVTTHVHAGETVYGRRSGGGTVIDKWQTTSFSGFLIAAEE